MNILYKIYQLACLYGLFLIWWLIAPFKYFGQFNFIIWFIICSTFIPSAFAIPQSAQFPDINFNVFSDFICQEFGPNISLATVLTLLFTLTENPELLSLHSRQQNPVFSDERKVIATGWIKSLSRAVLQRFKDSTKTLFKEREFPSQQNQQVLEISNKLDRFAKLLGFTPYSKTKKSKQKLLPISYESIKPIHVICPITAVQ